MTYLSGACKSVDLGSSSERDACTKHVIYLMLVSPATAPGTACNPGASTKSTVQAPHSVSPVPIPSIGYHTGCPGVDYDALGQPCVRFLGSSDFLNKESALYVQDADTISNQEDASVYQELPEADALAEPTEPTEPNEPTEQPFAKEPADDTDAFTIPIESIGTVTEGRTSAPAKAGMAKISLAWHATAEHAL